MKVCVSVHVYKRDSIAYVEVVSSRACLLMMTFLLADDDFNIQVVGTNKRLGL